MVLELLTTQDHRLRNGEQKWGTVHCTAINGPTSLAVANITGNVTGNVTGNAGSATQLFVTDDVNNTDYRVLFATAGGSGANRDVFSDANSFYFNPSSNTLGVSNIVCANIGTAGVTTFTGSLTGNADSATQVKVTQDAGTDTTYYVYFGENGGLSGVNRTVRSDNNVFTYNPSLNMLGVGEINCSIIGASGNTSFGNANQNAYGARTVSTGNPTGGSDGDIWYKY